jgi:3-oxoacyl-[acyl-carrier-protein] synthase-3
MSHENRLCRSEIGGVAFVVPDRVVTNKDLESLMDTSDEWIVQRTGIRERRWVEEGARTTDLGADAVRALFQKSGLKPGDVDLVIAATLSPDYYFPGIGTMIQRELGLPNVGALDLRVQCSGFTYGLAMADAFVRSGQCRNVVFVGAEIHSFVLDKTTKGRDVAVLFGDGAGAVWVRGEPLNEKGWPTASNGLRGVIDSLLGSDGSGAENLMMGAPGVATPGFVTMKEIQEDLCRPSMEGRIVFKHAVTRMTEAATTILKRNGLTAADVDLVVPHQANLRINEAVADKLGVGPDKVFNNIQRYGNTTSATIPICLAEAETAGVLRPGHVVLTLSFGAGFTWGANLIRW